MVSVPYVSLKWGSVHRIIIIHFAKNIAAICEDHALLCIQPLQDADTGLLNSRARWHPHASGHWC